LTLPQIPRSVAQTTAQHTPLAYSHTQHSAISNPGEGQPVKLSILIAIAALAANQVVLALLLVGFAGLIVLRTRTY